MMAFDRQLRLMDMSIYVLFRGCLQVIANNDNAKISRANIPEVEHHLNGIQKIVQLRGGIEALPMIRQFRTKVALSVPYTHSF